MNRYDRTLKEILKIAKSRGAKKLYICLATSPNIKTENDKKETEDK